MAGMTTRRSLLAAATTSLAFAFALAGAACTGQITGESVVAKPELRQPSAEGDLVEIHVLPDAIDLRYDGVVPTFATGDVVWGTEDTGYLRKVTAVRAEGASIHLDTV